MSSAPPDTPWATRRLDKIWMREEETVDGFYQRTIELLIEAKYSEEEKATWLISKLKQHLNKGLNKEAYNNVSELLQQVRKIENQLDLKSGFDQEVDAPIEGSGKKRVKAKDKSDKILCVLDTSPDKPMFYCEACQVTYLGMQNNCDWCTGLHETSKVILFVRVSGFCSMTGNKSGFCLFFGPNSQHNFTMSYDSRGRDRRQNAILATLSAISCALEGIYEWMYSPAQLTRIRVCVGTTERKEIADTLCSHLQHWEWHEASKTYIHHTKKSSHDVANSKEKREVGHTLEVMKERGVKVMCRPIRREENEVAIRLAEQAAIRAVSDYGDTLVSTAS
ncbi:hypothetical protein K490DRAFT_68935 [Saccharata proteae CBS 121410]|uniref:RNase H type-1 domain-containing protein n=1 Tax=Saccharata proteae CBS 121410 TaxID=1314787 RepID=A0A9P4HQ08_9PEZI|nr:hypothetical protein K490DRAFT_68935 [Saccharata proteae CBS 121410]